MKQNKAPTLSQLRKSNSHERTEMMEKPFFGDWSQQLLDEINQEVSKINSKAAIETKLVEFKGAEKYPWYKFLKSNKPGFVKLAKKIPEYVITLREFMTSEEYQNLTFIQNENEQDYADKFTKKSSIIAFLYSAYRDFVDAVANKYTHIKLMKLTPDNVYVDLRHHEDGIYHFRFSEYLPEIYFEDVVFKTNKDYDKNCYKKERTIPPQVQQFDSKENKSEDSIKPSPISPEQQPSYHRYIAPRYANIQNKDNLPIVSGLKEFQPEDSNYSLGILISWIMRGEDPLYKVKQERIPVKNGLKDKFTINFDTVETLRQNYVESRSKTDTWLYVAGNVGDQSFKDFIRALLNGNMAFTDLVNGKSSNGNIAFEYITKMQRAFKIKAPEKNQFKLIKNIGGGAYGTVFLVQDTKTNEIVALKQFDLNQDGITTFVPLNEFNLMDACTTNNAVKPFALYSSKESINEDSEGKKKYGNYVYLTMEYCDLGSLDSYVLKMWPSGRPNKEFIEHIFIKILCGLFFMHSERNIVHRDIKPNNILLIKGTNPLYPGVKISDLGVSRQIMNEDQGCTTKMQGTVEFMAPELTNDQIQIYSYKIDLWSFACLMYNMITFNLPFGYSGGNRMNLKFSKMRIFETEPSFEGSQWKGLEDMKEVLKHLLEYDDDERWGYTQLFRNKYIQKLLVEKKMRDCGCTEEEARKQVEEENETRNFRGLMNIQYKRMKE